MAEWARRMAERRRSSTIALTFAPSRIVPLSEVANVDDELAVFLRVGDFEFEAVADEAADVADLAAAFAVERRAVEDDADVLAWPTSSSLSQRWSWGGWPAMMPLIVASASRVVVAEELGGVERLLERVDRAAGAHHGVLHLAGNFAVLLHRGIVALPVEGEVVLGGERFEELGRDAVGLVELGGDVAIDGDAVLAAHVVEDAVDVVEAGVDRAEEVFFFLFDDAADALDRFLQLGIGGLHHLGHFGDELEEERIAEAHLVAVEHGAAEEALDDVLLLVGAGVDVFVDGEGAGADVVGDAAEAAAVVAIRIRT